MSILSHELANSCYPSAKLSDANHDTTIHTSSNHKTMNLTIRQHLQLCSRPQASLDYIIQNPSHRYHQIVTMGLKALHTFLPRKYLGNFPNNHCWFGRRPGLPDALHANFTQYRGCMPRVVDKYTTNEAIGIVKTALSTPVRTLGRHGRYLSSSQCNGGRRVTNPFKSNTYQAIWKCSSKYQLFCLPRVLLAGFPKCATSSLYSMLIRHPQIAQARTKEEHFWRDFFFGEIKLPHKQLQVLYYLFQFESASRRIRLHPSHLTIDGSTTTVFPGLCAPIENEEDICIFPKMLTHILPGQKVIFMMRDPVDRVYSDFWYLCSKFHWKTGDNITVPEPYLKEATSIFHNASTLVIGAFKACLGRRSVFECVRKASVGYAPEVACRGPRIGISSTISMLYDG